MGLPAELFGGRGAGEVAESLRCCGRFSPCRWQTRADLCNKEECTKNAVMAVVGDTIRALHSQLTARGVDCTLEWNSGGHFKDADLRTARAFQWEMEEHA